MDQKFLLFVDAENDLAMYPLSSLISITCAADEAIVLNFKNSLGGNATDAEIDGWSASYTMGSMSFTVHRSKGSGIGHAASMASEHTEASVTFAF